MSAKFFQNLLNLARGDGELFGQKLGEHRSTFSLGGEGGVLEQQLFGVARVLDSEGRLSEASLNTAIVACLRDRLAAEARALQGFVTREGGFGITSCLTELKRAAQICPVGDLAQRILAEGGRLRVERRTHRPVEVEENLLRP